MPSLRTLPSLPTVGERVAYARKLAGLSQTDAAAVIERARGVIVDIETGKREPQVTYLDAFATAFRVPVQWIRGEPGEWRQSPRGQSLERDDDGSSEAVLWVVDVETCERVLTADTIDQIEPLLAPNSDTLTVALPLAGARKVEWREALRMQDQVRARIAELRAQDGANGR